MKLCIIYSIQKAVHITSLLELINPFNTDPVKALHFAILV